MATAEQGGATTTTTENPYEGGAGGKFRKKTARRQTTPYDRPNNNISKVSWFKNLVVDQASKLLAYGANRLFGSVVPKQILPAQDVVNPDADEVTPESARNEELMAANCGHPVDSSNSNGISELENLLKRNTFTRPEALRLIELLHSRAVEVVACADESKIIETSSAFGRYDENRNEGVKSHGATTSSPIINSRVHEEDIGSPAELAKAYMGSRPSKVSPSMLGANRQVVREDTRLLTNIPSIASSPILPLTGKNSSIAAAENFFATPRSRGRSALYNMARTPYSRVPASSLKGGGNNNNDYGSSMPPRPVPITEHGEKIEPKSTNLKRRSSYLDEEVGTGSLGPIRRIKPKQNLLVPSTPQSARGVGIGSAKHKISLVEANHERNENEIVASTKYASVPTRSKVVASKILQHLQKMSPEKKSSGSEITALMDKSPFKSSTPGVLHEQGCRSMEDVGTSKFMLDGKTSDFLPGDIASQHPQKKRAFRMNGQEGGDVQYNGIASVSLSKEKGPIKENNLSFAEGLKSLKTTMQPEVKSTSDNVFTKISEFCSPSSEKTGEGSNGFAFFASDETNKASQYTAVPSPASVFDKPNDNLPSLFASSSNAGDKFPLLTSESINKNPELKLDGVSSFSNISAPNGFLKADIDLLKAADKIGKYTAPLAPNGLFGSGTSSTSSAKFTLAHAETTPLSVSEPSAAEVSQVTYINGSSDPMVLPCSSSNSGNDIFGHASSTLNNFQGSLHNTAKSNAFAGDSVPPQGSSSRPISSTPFPPFATNSSNAFGSSFSSSQPFNSNSVTPVGESTSTFMKFGSSSTANSVANTPSSFSNGASGMCNSVESSSTFPTQTNPFTSSSSTSSTPAPTNSIFGSTFNSSNPSTGFVFNSSSTPAPSNTAQPFSSPSASPNFQFGAASAPAISTSSVFGSTNFEPSPGKNNDQMNPEDSMAEDPRQSSTPIFGQPATSQSPPGFTFGQALPFQPKPFQFGGQMSPATPNPFPVSSSLEFNAGGSGGFSLGSGGGGGGDKSTRRSVKVNRNKFKKK